MKYDERRNHYTLSTGRDFYANCGIIGMSPDHVNPADGRDTHHDVPEGYDGGIYLHDIWGDTPEDNWTVAERHELADYMIDLWQQWKARQS